MFVMFAKGHPDDALYLFDIISRVVYFLGRFCADVGREVGGFVGSVGLTPCS